MRLHCNLTLVNPHCNTQVTTLSSPGWRGPAPGSALGTPSYSPGSGCVERRGRGRNTAGVVVAVVSPHKRGWLLGVGAASVGQHRERWRLLHSLWPGSDYLQEATNLPSSHWNHLPPIWLSSSPAALTATNDPSRLQSAKPPLTDAPTSTPLSRLPFVSHNQRLSHLQSGTPVVHSIRVSRTCNQAHLLSIQSESLAPAIRHTCCPFNQSLSHLQSGTPVVHSVHQPIHITICLFLCGKT
ncbi:uncharacterized protein LOC119493278 [Sebastes umbrosus]|uniref:uncharacterized protein LOC119493278 n=1 Tax=Sebastes umbrosus TaxID=72105 RepID=UPI0018A0BCFA|nr:uncharacterized protein LOC119493278 [Sebastes umbrosus]